MNQMEQITGRQCFLTVSAGKRLIAMAVAQSPVVQEACLHGTLVVMAGTTNGYVAEEILRQCGLDQEIDKVSFFRGVTTAPGRKLPERTGAYSATEGEIAGTNDFPGDLILCDGKLVQGKTIFDVTKSLKKGDVVIKGANAVNQEKGEAGILIGHNEMGTIGAILQACVGRRTRLILPVGLEKRVSGDLLALAAQINAPETSGLRMMAVSGDVVTECDAFRMLTGVEATLVGGGGVCGAEGGIWLLLRGTEEAHEKTSALLAKVSGEPAWDQA